MTEIKPGQVWRHRREKKVLIFILSINEFDSRICEILYLDTLKFSNWYAETVTNYYKLVK
jgi:hypothetical protein